MSSYLIQGRRREREVRVACVIPSYGCWCLAHKCTYIELPELHSYPTASCNYLANSRSVPKIDEASSKCSFPPRLPSIYTCCLAFTVHDSFWQFTRYVVKGVHYVVTTIAIKLPLCYIRREITRCTLTNERLWNVVLFHSFAFTSASFNWKFFTKIRRDVINRFWDVHWFER